jgi:HEAT repeat protein
MRAATMADHANVWALITLLGDKNEDLRLNAREQMVRLGLDAVPTLVQAIDAQLFPEEELPWACDVLAEIKPRYAGEKPDALIEAIESESADVCHAASRALVNYGTAATAPLLELLTRGDKRIYSSPAGALVQIAKVDPSIMPAVIEAMDDENWNVRAGAAQILFDTQPPPMEAIAPLIRSLREEDPYRRIHIISALEQFGVAAIPALLASLRSPDWRIRVGSAGALGMIELVRKVRSDREPWFEMGVVPALVEALGDEKVEVLLAAGDALSKIGPPETNPAVPVFLNILRKRNPLTFPAAASEMRWIPYSEAGLEAELIDALADRDAAIRAAAANLLRNIEAPATSAAVPVLLAALDDEVEEVRFQAARALAEIAPALSAAGVPALHSALLHTRDREHMEAAIRALGRNGPAAAAAVPTLVNALNDYWLAAWAAEALGRMGPFASAAVPGLLQALQGSDEDIRYAAAAALAAIGPASATAAVNILLDRLREPGEYNRCSAADCLGTIGLPAANVAVPTLLELMNDESECTRYHVAQALNDLNDLGCRPPDHD